MTNFTIKVSPLLANIGFRESPKVEFKTSMFRGPKGSRIPQVEVIAQTIASFMNADGGSLYLGVRDDGEITGIEDDVKDLRTQSRNTTLYGGYASDSGYSYQDGDAVDIYLRKLIAIVKGYLGPFAATLVDNANVGVCSNGRKYIELPIRSAKGVGLILFKTQNQETQLWSRVQTSKVLLRNEERDKFVEKHARNVSKQEVQDLVNELMRQMQSREAENSELRAESKAKDMRLDALIKAVEGLGGKKVSAKEIEENIKSREAEERKIGEASRRKEKDVEMEFQMWKDKFDALLYPHKDKFFAELGL